jgi:hypothetical protein
MLWIPAGVIPFFKSGPLAWNGVFAWWVPLSVYFCWFVLMVVLLLRAIADDERQQARGAAESPASHQSPEPAKHTVS